jgi:hypothetical protein
MCAIINEQEQHAFTGVFAQDSPRALKAANRISWKMNQALDALEAAESTF